MPHLHRALLVVAACALLLSACGSGGTIPGTVGPPLRWQQIHTTDDPSVLLIPVPEDTTDPTSPCWQRYVATPDVRGTTISITLTQLPLHAAAAGTSCVDVAVRGDFYVSVTLPVPYDGQTLVDAADQERHRLGTRIVLSSLTISPM